MKHNFEERLHSCRIALDAILFSATNLMESNELKEVLFFVLKLGNFLNSVSKFDSPNFLFFIETSSYCVKISVKQ